ncbi:hypothetical protein MVEN_02386800 [Mycena venus]|uniref:Uncharacterized protein n=1 Tax=Mycena venus TaxID=2733690 RepID=A0A8H6X1S2_9AGAR|nr:hypothetical protein MVEN_02386800 [Mycena venus]
MLIFFFVFISVEEVIHKAGVRSDNPARPSPPPRPQPRHHTRRPNVIPSSLDPIHKSRHSPNAYVHNGEGHLFLDDFAGGAGTMFVRCLFFFFVVSLAIFPPFSIRPSTPFFLPCSTVVSFACFLSRPPPSLLSFLRISHTNFPSLQAPIECSIALIAMLGGVLPPGKIACYELSFLGRCAAGVPAIEEHCRLRIFFIRMLAYICLTQPSNPTNLTTEASAGSNTLPTRVFSIGAGEVEVHVSNGLASG